MTQDEYNLAWTARLSAAYDLESLASWTADAQQSEHWNGELAKYACTLMVSLWQRGGS